VEEFSEQFCKRCFTKDCVRSLAGTSAFERRVKTWEERLFLNPPTMPKTDGRWSGIVAKRWRENPLGPVTLSPTRQSAWIDPKDLDGPPLEAQEELSAPDTPPPPEPQLEAEPPSEPVPPPPELEPPKPRPKAKPEPEPVEPERAPIAAQLMNTPDQGARMLAGHEPQKEEPKEEKDPWAVPKPTNPGGQEGDVVEPGARIRLGR